MAWTERLNRAVSRMRLGGAVIDVYEWARWDGPVENPPHRHTYFEICRIDGGAGEFVAGGDRHTVGKGDLLFARPGVRHQIIGHNGIRLSWVACDISIDLGQDDETTQLLQAFVDSETSMVRNDEGVGAIWRALKLAKGRPDQLQALAQALILGVAGNVKPGKASQTEFARHDRAVRNAVRYIHDNLDRPLRVDELARHVHLSPRQLTRLFSNALNASPASYVERVRLERAAALLVRTNTPIKQIAAHLGYPDIASFTRAFSRRHGRPTGRFRAAGDLSRVTTAPAGIVKDTTGTHKDSRMPETAVSQA